MTQSKGWYSLKAPRRLICPGPEPTGKRTLAGVRLQPGQTSSPKLSTEACGHIPVVWMQVNLSLVRLFLHLPQLIISALGSSRRWWRWPWITEVILFRGVPLTGLWRAVSLFSSGTGIAPPLHGFPMFSVLFVFLRTWLWKANKKISSCFPALSLLHTKSYRRAHHEMRGLCEPLEVVKGHELNQNWLALTCICLYFKVST